MTDSSNLPANPSPIEVFLVRGEQVILDSSVAAGFGTDTKRVNEAFRRNPDKFSNDHGFQLTPEEAEALRSQRATSNTGRGGSRYAPHVYTAKGVARLATILNTDQALRATDLIIDTFLEVQRQVAAGTKQIAIHHPSRLRADDDDQDYAALAKMRKQLGRAVSTLLDTVIDTANDQTVRQVSQQLASGALDNVRERLRTKGLENAKLEADTMLVLAEAEKLMAEVRKTNAEVDGINIDNIAKRIAVVRELRTLVRDSEPTQVIQLLTRIEQSEPMLLPPPTPPSDEETE